MIELSIVVPLYNEEENVARLHEEIVHALQNKAIYEIILVDDGSNDQTFARARELKPVKAIRLRKNCGQTAAMDAGIHAAQYPLIVTMDGDLQNDPADILRLVEHLEANNLDVVSGWRVKRQDRFGKKLVSRVANLIRGVIVKDHIHDSGCSLKAYRRICFEDVHLYGEMHRFIPAYLAIKGFTVGELPVNHRPRTAGKTKYNWKRTIKGLLDMISVWFWNRYAVRPLHLLGALGIASTILGMAFGVWTLVLAIRGHDLSDNLQPFMALFFGAMGVLFIILGLLTDMMAKIYYGHGIERSYYVKEIVIHEAEARADH
jgi:glycosyltransferase involved in cell wall biosynthesis